MTRSRPALAAALLLAASAGLCAAPPLAFASETAPAAVTPEEAFSIAREGYEMLMPIVIMDLTRRGQATQAPGGPPPRVPGVNRFVHAEAFPSGEFREIVRPNFDTLYSTAWIDVSMGPVTLAVKPGMDRYYLLPLMDMWTDVFAVPGTRTVGDQGGKFMIVSRHWTGKAPADVEVIRAPTDLVWLIARIQTNGPKDYAHVRTLQQGVTLTPSVAPPAPEIDATFNRTVPVARQIIAMPAETFFAEAARLTGLYPPHDVDQPALARLARIGFKPGKPFDLAALPPTIQTAIKRAQLDLLMSYRGAGLSVGEKRGTWRFQPNNLGAYGGDYRLRALVAMGGLGANRIEDAIYPNTGVDAAGQPLVGTKSYKLHFEKANLPPAGAFWSLTAYDLTGFPIPNPEKRYAVGDRDPLVFNADGSLDLYVGQNPPDAATLKPNWLPTAADPYNLTLRVYLPKREVLDGRWTPPPVTAIETKASPDKAKAPGV